MLKVRLESGSLWTGIAFRPFRRAVCLLLTSSAPSIHRPTRPSSLLPTCTFSSCSSEASTRLTTGRTSVEGDEPSPKVPQHLGRIVVGREGAHSGCRAIVLLVVHCHVILRQLERSRLARKREAPPDFGEAVPELARYQRMLQQLLQAAPSHFLACTLKGRRPKLARRPAEALPRLGAQQGFRSSPRSCSVEQHSLPMAPTATPPPQQRPSDSPIAGDAELPFAKAEVEEATAEAGKRVDAPTSGLTDQTFHKNGLTDQTSYLPLK